MIRRLGIMALASLAVGACAELAFLEEFTASSGADVPVPARQGPAEPNPADQVLFGPPLRYESETQAAVAAPPMPRRKPSRAEPVVLADPDPELLVGLDFEATKALLGDPALKMEQPPATVWAYNGGFCKFSVFFYPSMDDSVFRVLTYEVTGKEPDLPLQAASGASETGPVKIRDRKSPILRRCFADLLNERDVPDAG